MYFRQRLPIIDRHATLTNALCCASHRRGAAARYRQATRLVMAIIEVVAAMLKALAAACRDWPSAFAHEERCYRRLISPAIEITS